MKVGDTGAIRFDSCTTYCPKEIIMEVRAIGLLDMIFKRNKDYGISEWESLYSLSEETHLKQMALDTVVGRIQSACALVSIHTLDSGMRYRLNVKPNRNQNAVEFRDKLIYNLLHEGEALAVIVDDQLLLVDSWECDNSVIKERKYQNLVVAGLKLQGTYLSSDVLHFKYRNDKLNRYLKDLTDSYAKLFNRTVEVQMRESQLRIFAKFPGTSGKNDAAKNEQKFKNFLKGLENALNTQSVVVAPRQDDYEIDEHKAAYLGRSSSELGVIENIYLKNVANALQVSPLLFSGDLADVSQHTENFIIQCVQPLMEIIVTEFNAKCFEKEELEHSRLTYNTFRLLYASEFKMAKDVEKMVGSAVWTIDDVLELMGRASIGSKLTSRRYLTKNLAPLDDDGQVMDN